MKNKKLVAILTMLCFLFTLMPTMALADTATASVTVNGVELGNDKYIASNGSATADTEPATGGYAHFDATTDTLTLNNFNVTVSGDGIKYTGENALNIELEGANAITVEGKSDDGIDATDKAIVIKGTGTLTLGTENMLSDACGIRAKNTTIESGAQVIIDWFGTGIEGKGGAHIVNGAGTVVTMSNVGTGYAIDSTDNDGTVTVNAGTLEIIARSFAIMGDNGLNYYSAAKVWVGKLSSNNNNMFDVTEYNVNDNCIKNESNGDVYDYIKVASSGSAPIPVLTFPLTVVNGTIVDTDKAKGNFAQGTEVTIKANTAAEGQEFAGWSVESGDFTLTDTSGEAKFEMPRKVVKVTATYKDGPAATEYTVTFNMNGVTANATIANVTAEKDGTVTKPANPTATGYTFGGWYREADCTNEWNFDTDTVDADTTLYAKWTQNSDPTDTTVRKYDIWVNGDQVTSANCNDTANKWSYDADTNTLTLEEDFTGTGLYNVDDYSYSNCRPVIYSEQDLTINIAGDSTITLNGTNIGGSSSHGIFCDGALTFIGSGTLTVTQSSSGGYDPIQCKKTITFGSANDKQQFTGNVIAVVENETQAGSAISAGKEIVINSGIVEATNYGATYNALSGDVILNGGTLTAKGNGKAIVGTLTGKVKVSRDFGGADAEQIDSVEATKLTEYKYISNKNVTSTTPDPTPTPDDDKEDTTPSTSTSGGGFTGKYNYPVVTGAVENADVDFSKNYAVAGDTVAITVAPEAGKQVDTVIVTDKDGKVIPVTKVGENKYTFTMPASKVTVSVTTETADAADNADEKEIVLQIGNTTVLVDGSAVKNDVAPTLLNGRTLVPLRVIVTALGGDVDWDEATRTVTITIDGKVLKLVIDEHIPGFGQGATIMDSRTYVPIRYVGQYIGADVEWIKDTQKIVIVK